MMIGPRPLSIGYREYFMGFQLQICLVRVYVDDVLIYIYMNALYQKTMGASDHKIIHQDHPKAPREMYHWMRVLSNNPSQ